MLRPLLSLNKATGRAVKRPRFITELLNQLLELPYVEIVRRAKIRSEDSPEFIPSECLLYFLRSGSEDLSHYVYEVLYKVLIGRVRKILSRGVRSDYKTIHTTDLGSLMRERVLDQFEGWLAQEDSGNYCLKLDFFEVKFNFTLKRRRIDAFRKLENDQKPLDSLDELKSRAQIDVLEHQLTGSDLSLENGVVCRLLLEQAINSLNPEHRSVITMHQQGYLFYSTDPDEETIAKMLGKSDKTVREYYKKAIKALQNFFLLEDGYE